jgi:hypothetical protein
MRRKYLLCTSKEIKYRSIIGHSGQLRTHDVPTYITQQALASTRRVEQYHILALSTTVLVYLLQIRG